MITVEESWNKVEIVTICIINTDKFWHGYVYVNGSNRYIFGSFCHLCETDAYDSCTKWFRSRKSTSPRFF